LVGEAIPDVAEEVAAAGIGIEKLLVLFGRKGEVRVNCAAMEAQVKAPPGGDIGRGSQEL
jgi:hypothetical protein